jgi:malate dehydrogenase (oxaloacetate-decarboxylating)
MEIMKQKKQDNNKASLALHKKLRGKVSIIPKIAVKNKQDLSLVYTPGVAAVSSYIAAHKDKLAEYTMKGNTVAVVSDGSAVLGLGNIGPEGALPVMEGKSMLFKALSGIDAFPIVLDTQDTEEIIRTVKNIAPVFGGINLEDIAAPRCFEIEHRLQAELSIPVLHDDQHGTALVVLAGIINAFKVVKKSPKKAEIVIAGAGAAGSAIAELLMLYGVGNVVLLDSNGILHHKRTDLHGKKEKLALVKQTNKKNLSGGLDEALSGADVFIGVSKGNTVTEKQIRSMADKAIVFALANPMPEIMPDLAKKAGAMVVATGRSDFANQINNSLGFPGIFRGALDHKVKKITDTMLIRAAKNLAAVVKRPSAECIVPNTFDKAVVPAVAKAIR